MPIFEYKAFAAKGGTKTGIVDADTPREARAKLRKDNVLVSEIKEVKGGRKQKLKSGASNRSKLASKLADLRASSSGAKGKDLELISAATRQLGTMLGSGIALTEALRALVEQAQTRKEESLFREIRERVTQGAPLADAFAEQPQWFSDLYVNMVRAGQATGNLDVIFRRLADYMQSQRALRRKIVSALTYPAMMIGIGMIVVSILMVKVVPKITEMLLDLGQTLPTPTRILIGISAFFSSWWWLLLLAIGAMAYAFERVYNRSEKGRLFIDKSFLRIPLIGDLLRKQAVSRFTSTLSTLLQSGVPVVNSLEITEKVVGNRVIADATGFIRTRIVEGTDIATPLKQTGVFPSVVGYMVSVGEQSGEMEQMLDRIGAAYDEEIEITAERMTSVLEPIMIVFLAVVVGFIVISIILPILQVGQVQ